jgi:hypothetical protein
MVLALWYFTLGFLPSLLLALLSFLFSASVSHPIPFMLLSRLSYPIQWLQQLSSCTQTHLEPLGFPTHIIFFFFFFVGLGVWTQGFTLAKAGTQPLGLQLQSILLWFWRWHLENYLLEQVVLNLWLSVSQVNRITGMRHWRQLSNIHLSNGYSNGTKTHSLPSKLKRKQNQWLLRSPSQNIHIP